MATASQLKALLKSHVDSDSERFYSIALQVAAREARAGHHKVASEIKALVEKGQKNSSRQTQQPSTPIRARLTPDLEGLLELCNPSTRFNELVVEDSTKDRLERIVYEQQQKSKLKKYQLLPRRKILLTGPPGTGKTLTASALATELKLPLYKIVLENLITRYMGETAAKLSLIFDHIEKTRAVYLFDEFDAIGSQRGAQNDVGEIRRVLNTFLVLVENDHSESLLIAATNHPELLDRALHRRFDDVIEFKNPSPKEVSEIIRNRLTSFDLTSIDLDKLGQIGAGLSAADLTRACEDAAKEAVLHHDSALTAALIKDSIEYRKRHNS